MGGYEVIKPDETSHVFIVRIWWETRDLEHEPMFWRGKVEYLNLRTEKFFSNLDDLTSFLDFHIQATGAREMPPTPENWIRKVRRWVKRVLKIH